jgi:hypothetical protein
VLTKTLAFGTIAVFVVGVAWWLIDPVGFANNPVIAYLKNVSSHSGDRVPHF